MKAPPAVEVAAVEVQARPAQVWLAALRPHIHMKAKPDIRMTRNQPLSILPRLQRTRQHQPLILRLRQRTRQHRPLNLPRPQ